MNWASTSDKVRPPIVLHSHKVSLPNLKRKSAKTIPRIAAVDWSVHTTCWQVLKKVLSASVSQSEFQHLIGP